MGSAAEDSDVADGAGYESTEVVIELFLQVSGTENFYRSLFLLVS